jgi:hypothetical protein
MQRGGNISINDHFSTHKPGKFRELTFAAIFSFAVRLLFMLDRKQHKENRMNTYRWKKAGLFLALIGAASLAYAENPGGKGAGGKGAGKGRGDGEQPGREEMLKKYDADGDGQLSDKERKKMQKDRQRARQHQKDRQRVEKVE